MYTCVDISGMYIHTYGFKLYEFYNYVIRMYVCVHYVKCVHIIPTHHMHTTHAHPHPHNTHRAHTHTTHTVHKPTQHTPCTRPCQLAQLRGMGVVDEAACVHALEATGGNVEAALEVLLGSGV